jgi:hypothetical protein
MNTRFIVSISTLVLLVGANAFLLQAEEFEVRSLKEVRTVDDPLAGLKFDGDSERILKRMGFGKAMRDAILPVSIRTNRKYGERLQKQFLKSDRMAQLSEDLCGSGVLPRRYMLLENLVSQGKGGRVVLKPNRIRFEVQDWFALSNIEALHTKFERTEGSPDDATVRILAAVLASKETEFEDSSGLWSRNDWNWGRLCAEHPQLQQKLTDFSALALVVLQRAQKALCGGE